MDKSRSRALVVAFALALVLHVFPTRAIAQPLTCAPAPSGLVSWWKGEGDTSDEFGNNTGTLAGGASYGPGEVGQGFVLSGNGQGVGVGNPTNLHLQNFTIECWILRNSSTHSTQDGATSANLFAFNGGGYGLGLLDDGRIFLSKINVSGVFSTAAVTDTSSFHHVAVTKSGTNVMLYVDGVGESAGPYDPGFAFTSAAAIGGRGGDYEGCFFGTIDEVAVYNRALAPVEVQALYNAGTSGKCGAGTPPYVYADPVDQTLRAGTNATFAVFVGGSPQLFFQWQFNGTNLSGATGSSMTLTNVQPAIAGGYQAVITNAFGAVTSGVANLILATPVVINDQPQSVVVPSGSSTQFLVGVSGTPPFFFQWMRDGTNLRGANNYALFLSNVQAADAVGYTVVVTNAYGSATSSPAFLYLAVPPSIVSQPSSQVVPAGANLIFNVGVSGPPVPLKYQWHFGATNLPGATSSMLSLINVLASNVGAYSVIVSNDFGWIQSSNALLTITNPVCIASPAGLVGWWQGETSAVEVLSGIAGALRGNATYAAGKVGQAFSFASNGDAVLLTNTAPYQLQDFSIEAWVKRSSTNKASQSPSGGQIFGYGSGGYGFGLFDDGRPYLTRIGIDNISANCQVADTNWHHVAVTKAGSNCVFYLDGSLCTATNFNSTFAFTTPVAIGARADNLTATFLGRIDEVDLFGRALAPAEIQALYYSVGLGKCPSLPSWALQPTNQSVTLGSNATFVAAVGPGTRPISYRWFFNGAELAGTTNSSLTLLNATYFQSGIYAVTASNTAGSVGSSNVLLAVQPVPLFANGSFESGDASGWILSDISGALTPLAVRGAGYNSGLGFFSVAPVNGNFCLTDGFDGNGPGRIRAAFDVVLPPSPATLSFNYRAAWDMQNYTGSTKARTFGVTIEPFGGGVGLQTNIILVASPGTANYDTGNLTGTVDLSAFYDRAIRISFDANIPESYTGPGFFELDNVSLYYLPQPPLLIAKSSSNVVLSWPFAFSNFIAQASTNLNVPITWASLPANLIVLSATNHSLTLPITNRYGFYRLKSQ